ncbi:MAG: hypothetical protein LIP01_11820 [Tannerellaceae bacterium]|nr:hypothetical protein [Tannerellaceae bacterium]
MAELSDLVYNDILTSLEKGDEAMESGEENYSLALEQYQAALTAIPQPKTDWEISLHVYTALGDLYFNMEDYESAVQAYAEAQKCPDGLEMGHIWLGLGQSYYEIDEEEKAKKALLRAYELEGEDIFEDCEDYFEIIKGDI